MKKKTFLYMLFEAIRRGCHSVFKKTPNELEIIEKKKKLKLKKRTLLEHHLIEFYVFK